MNQSEPEFIFDQQWKADGMPPLEREYRFHPVRRYRFDFALPAHMLAIEIDGGIFGKGGHSTPLGITRDMEKGNLAVMCGWSVLRFTPAQVACGQAIEMVKKWLSVFSQEPKA